MERSTSISTASKTGPPPLTRKEIEEEEKAEKFRIPDEVSPERKQEIVDAVWGVQPTDGSGPNYKGLGWIRTSVLLLKLQIGLGVLSIPSVFDTLGLVPGIILLLTIAAITSWSAYVIGVFKQRYPQCHSAADVGYLWWGPIGRELVGGFYWLYLAFNSASAFLSISISLNAMSLHGTCTQVFVVVGLIVCFCLASIQTLDRVSYIGWVGLFSIIGAILTLAISVGVEDRPAAAPQTGPWDKDLHIVAQPTFAAAMNAVCTLLFAYGSTPAYMNVVAEMRDPRGFTKAAITAQSVMTAVYISLSIVVYYYCGQYVASPALGSAGALMKRICYGIALPGLITSGLLITHLPSKYIFVRILRGSHHLARNTPTHWVTWLGSVAFTAILSYIIASAIPFFGDLISLIGALFGPAFGIMLEAGMYMHLVWPQVKQPELRTRWFWCGMVINVALVLVGLFITVGGLYGAVVQIRDDFAANNLSQPWSCADNSAST